MRRLNPSEDVSELAILRDLMLGGRHSRRTVAALGVSLPTADRWLHALRMIPGVRTVRVGNVTWFEWGRSAYASLTDPLIAECTRKVDAVLARAAKGIGKKRAQPDPLDEERARKAKRPPRRRRGAPLPRHGISESS